MTLRFIWFFVLIDAIIGAQLMNCPQDFVKFEKILGLGPSQIENPLPLYQANNGPVTLQCLERCRSNAECMSFVVNFNASSCYWYRNYINGAQELNNVVDNEVAWFVKTCYNVKNCENLWTFERIPGATLVGNDTRTLPEFLTRSDCQQKCLDETSFTCRSVKFKIRENGEETVGVCVLSNTDRHDSPGSYRVSGFDEEYFENQCVDPEFRGEFCAYEEFDNATLGHADVLVEEKTKDQCQELCETNQDFNCRGFSVVPIENRSFNCLLHSEDSKVHGPKLLRENPSGRYFEKAQCINISVSCSETYMTVTYKPREAFYGEMYMRGFSEQPECHMKGGGYQPVSLKLPLLSSQCGIIKANSPNNRTLTSGFMILQFNPLIQTQADRVIRVGCIFGNDSSVVLGTGVTISTAPNKGTTLINTTNSAMSPTVEMRVVDLITQQEVSTTQIGQELQLIIESAPGGAYDIWAGHLVAMTEKSDESILLLDDRGCPTNLNVFPALEKFVTNSTRRLQATFQAFKFSSSPIVRFSVIVQFCPGTCPQINCTNARIHRSVVTVVPINLTEYDEKYRTSGRQMPLEFIMLVRNPGAIADKLIIGDNKILIAGYDFTTNEVCLDYSLFIGIVITLILVQVIFSVSCIVLVKRYKRFYERECLKQSMEELHKNFGFGSNNLENRRVRWADNEDFT